MPRNILTVTEKHVGKRLDLFIGHYEPHVSRSRIQTLIKEGGVLVNSCRERPGYRVRLGDSVEIELPDKKSHAVLPEPIPLDVIYEDEYMVVLNKPAGLVVHPAPGNYTGTLVNALLYHYGGLPSIGDEAGAERAGIVHRLDKDTSGVMVVARTREALSALSSQFKNRIVQKKYLVIVAGVIKKGSGVIEAGIGRHVKDRKKISVHTQKARDALTIFRVKERLKDATLLEVEIKTGRTHQIRVHMAYIGHPVLGDRVYGGARVTKIGDIVLSRQMLHAESLSLLHPVTSHPMKFIAPLPPDFADAVQKLKRQGAP